VRQDDHKRNGWELPAAALELLPKREGVMWLDNALEYYFSGRWLKYAACIAIGYWLHP
jgi:hypothetical protein